MIEIYISFKKGEIYIFLEFWKDDNRNIILDDVLDFEIRMAIS